MIEDDFLSNIDSHKATQEKDEALSIAPYNNPEIHRNNQAHQRETQVRKYAFLIIICCLLIVTGLVVFDALVFKSSDHIKEVIDILKTIALFVVGYLFAKVSSRD